MSLNRHLKTIRNFILFIAFFTAIFYLWNNFNANQLKYSKKLAAGGDLEIGSWSAIPYDISSYLLFSGAKISRTAETSTVAQHGAIKSNVSLKGIDLTYPLEGTLQLKKGNRKYPFFVRKADKLYGAALDKKALKELRLSIGDIFIIGDSYFEVTAAIINEPDAAIGRMALLPRIIVNANAFSATIPIDENAKNIIFRCRGKLDKESASLTEIENHVFSYFPETPWKMRSWKDPRF